MTADNNWIQLFNPNMGVTQVVQGTITVTPGLDAALALAVNYTDTTSLTIQFDLDNNGTFDRTYTESDAVQNNLFGVPEGVLATQPLPTVGELNSLVFIVPFGTDPFAGSSYRVVTARVTGTVSTSILATFGSFHGVDQTNPIDSAAARISNVVSSASDISFPFGTVADGNRMFDAIMGLEQTDDGVPIAATFQPDRLGTDPSNGDFLKDQVAVLNAVRTVGPSTVFHAAASSDDDDLAGASPQEEMNWGFFPEGVAGFTHVAVEIQMSAGGEDFFEYDGSDAPNKYGLALHVPTGPMLGDYRDREFLSQATFNQNAAANGDDLHFGAAANPVIGGPYSAGPADDDDGVTNIGTGGFTGSLISKTSGSNIGMFDVEVNGIDMANKQVAYLTAHVDWGRDFSFIDGIDTLTFVDKGGTPIAGPLAITANGTQTLSFLIPPSANVVPGISYLRVRIHTASMGEDKSLAWNDLHANDGEVEDYAVTLESQPDQPGFDFGDAPDSYGTTLAAGGANHAAIGPVLGPSGDRDSEFNGFPTASANGDDFNTGILAPGPVPGGDDERGVTNFRTNGVAGAPNTFVFQPLGTSKGSVDIQVNDLIPTGDDVIFFVPAYITAYVDWNRDGDFQESNERVISGAQVNNNGTATYAFTIPDGLTTKAGTSYMRVRVHSSGQNPLILPPTGFAYTGEVEDYAITLQPQSTIPPDQFEQNDTSATAANLGSGDKNYNGLTIDAVGDDDWYRWFAPTSGSASVDVIFEQAEGKDVDLYVYDGQGKALGSSTNFFGNEHVTFNTTAGKDYLIWVDAGPVHPHYDLIIKAGEGPIPPDQFEQNDTAATAKDLGSGDKSHPGLTIDTAGDDDWYRWQSPANGPLSVEVLFTHAPNNDVDLAVYNAAGTTLLGSSTSVTNNEKVTLNATAGQSFLIRVYGDSGSVHRDYDLVIDGPAAAILVDQFEQNDTAATARDLGTGDKNYGDLTIDAVGDDDWYRWLAPATGPLSVGIIFEQEEGRDVDLYLHDTSGKELGSSTQFFGNEEVKIGVTAGQSYLIRVFAGSTHPDYRLVIDGPDVKLAADFNLDGRVDGNDLLILQTGVGILTGANHSDGDADADGDVDAFDFQIWQVEYSSLAGIGAAVSPAITSNASSPTLGDPFIGHARSMSFNPPRDDLLELDVLQHGTLSADETEQAGTDKRGKSSRLKSQVGALQTEIGRTAVDRFFELLSEGRSLLRSYWH